MTRPRLDRRLVAEGVGTLRAHFNPPVTIARSLTDTFASARSGMTYAAVCENSSMRISGAARRARGEPSDERLATLFRAFGDRNRLRILHVLRQGEVCVGDLVKVLRIPQARVSRHLAYLRRAGLVDVRKSGLWMYYSLGPATGPVHSTLLACLSGCFQDLPEFAADARRNADIRSAGGCCPN